MTRYVVRAGCPITASGAGRLRVRNFDIQRNWRCDAEDFDIVSASTATGPFDRIPDTNWQSQLGQGLCRKDFSFSRFGLECPSGK